MMNLARKYNVGFDIHEEDFYGTIMDKQGEIITRGSVKYSKEGITDTSFSYKIPDDNSYYLIIYNPNNSTATVDYEYTDLFEERVEEAATFIGMGIAFCIGIIIVIIVVIVLIIYFLTRKKD